ncbi:MAG: hypothetical protein QGG64_09225 [Candidatus Latescibacteria bacterium]|nr:hypothetical protein [Candidatus Latescibacterota bacterium]
MNISDFAFRILIIFFPGIIGFLIVDALTEHRERTPFQIGLYSFVLGLSSYVALYYLNNAISFISHWIGWPHSFTVDIFASFSQTKPTINLSETFWATICILPLSLGISKILNEKIIHRFAHWIGVSRKFGDLDVWSYTFTIKDAEWVVVRDLDHNLYYEGWIQAFSPTYKENELLLRDVQVFRNDTGEKLYDVGALYLSRSPENLTLELDVPLTEYINRTDKQ